VCFVWRELHFMALFLSHLRLKGAPKPICGSSFKKKRGKWLNDWLTDWMNDWETGWIPWHSDADLTAACGQKKPGKSCFSLRRNCGAEVNHCNYFWGIRVELFRPRQLISGHSIRAYYFPVFIGHSPVNQRLK